MSKRNGFVLGIEGFLIGGIVGGLAALLLAPQSGVETRHDINKYMRFARIKRKKLVKDARYQSNELIKRAEEILNKSKSYASGKYAGTIEGFEKEMESLRAGLNKAVETYKNFPSDKTTDNMLEEIFIDFDESSGKNPDEDRFPKHEGMGRRKE